MALSFADAGQLARSDVCLMVASDTTILASGILATVPGNAVTDAQIQSAVNAAWNALAGA